MNELSCALLLLDASKLEEKIILSLDVLHNTNTCREITMYKISEIGNLVYLDNAEIIKGLNSLMNKNVIGRVTFSVGLTDRTILENLSDTFVRTLYSRKDVWQQAISNAGFYIADVDSSYVLNTNTKTWKYPSKKSTKIILKSLTKNFDTNFLKSVTRSFKNGNNLDNNTKVNEWGIKESIRLFQDKYKKHYNAIYEVDWKIEYRLMKNLLSQLNTNKIPANKLGSFFDFAFNKAKDRKNVLHIFNLKYYANEFITNIVKRKEQESKYYYDEQGNLRMKKSSKTKGV